MTQHEDEVALDHMRSHACEAINLALGRSLEDLRIDRSFELALTRLVEIVGEASIRVSDEYKAMNPQIPWARMRGMRNRLIHGYDQVDRQILWDTVQFELGPLLEQLQHLRSDE